MAEIKRYVASQPLQAQRTPTPNLANPVAEELQRAGQAVQQVANVWQQRLEQRENFKVENDYRKMQLDLSNQMSELQTTMPEDGMGFHDKFIDEKYKPARDQFLATVPDRLKPKFETLLADDTGADTTEWSIKASTVERDQNYGWQKQQINLATNEQAAAISMNPEGYDAYLKDGLNLIETSSLPTPEKMKLKQDWTNMAQVSMLNKLLETDPRGVLRELGYDPRQLSPTTQFEILSRAVQWQESADHPDAVSSKGAVGLMQVMPGTAREIAAKLGDTNFPAGESDAMVAAYMTNPYVNKMYGEYYLKQQLRTFSGARDPVEAALVAYNAGPGVAQKWIESGYSDKVLPKETRDYRDQIMATLKSSPVKGDPQSVQFEYKGQTLPARGSGERFVVGKPAGLTQAGNIDLYARPQAQNADGSISTVRSMSFEEDGVEILVPTVSPDGRVLSDKEAIAQYKTSGQFLGKFSSAAAATAYAKNLHKQQESFYSEGIPDVSPDLQNRVKDAFATVGLTKVKVNSGFRTPEENAAAGGADQSQHLNGNALDIDVSNMKLTERIELIKALSNSGITGIGVYANTIHADLGGRRAWGPDHTADSVPKWASAVLGQHLNGTTPPPRATNQRYASLPYDQRQQFTSKADQLITAGAAAATKSSAVDKVNVKQGMENNLALIRTTGQGAAGFDETAVSTILGEDDYVTYQRKADVARQMFTGTQGIKTMSLADMEARHNEYEPDPNAPDFADQQSIQAAVDKEIARVTNLRAHQPDKAALEFPEIAGSYKALQDQLVGGSAQPADVQKFVQQMITTQRSFGTAQKAIAPIPSEWAMEIGQSLSRVPDPKSGNTRDVKAAILAQYQELQKYFGDFTDEVITYSLSEYKGLTPATAKMVNGYMTAISTGKAATDVIRLDQAVDASQVEAFNLFGWYPFGGGPATEGLSTEEQLRAQSASEDTTTTPEE